MLVACAFICGLPNHRCHDTLHHAAASILCPFRMQLLYLIVKDRLRHTFRSHLQVIQEHYESLLGP
jgi:hypothetical protein